MRMRTVFFLCLLTLPALVLAQDSAITMTYQGTLHDAGGGWHSPIAKAEEWSCLRLLLPGSRVEPHLGGV